MKGRDGVNKGGAGGEGWGERKGKDGVKRGGMGEGEECGKGGAGKQGSGRGPQEAGRDFPRRRAALG